MEVTTAQIEATCPRCGEPIEVQGFYDKDGNWRYYWINVGGRFKLSHEHQPKVQP